MNERIIMRASDLLSFAMEAKVPESEFLAAITYILAVKLASMPKRERERGLEDIRELVEACVEVANELPADKKEFLKRCGWEFDEK